MHALVIAHESKGVVMAGPCVFGALHESLADRVLSGAWHVSGDNASTETDDTGPFWQRMVPLP